MEIIYEKLNEDIKDPEQAHHNDSGYDLFYPGETIFLQRGERITVNLGIKFDIDMNGISYAMKRDFCIGVELQIRPKSGLSKKGIDVELGTIDEGYRGFVGCTITNNSNHDTKIEQHQKICQIVCVPVFNRIVMVKGKVDENTARSTNGFGSTGIN